jgi:hypothetical protein
LVHSGSPSAAPFPLRPVVADPLRVNHGDGDPGLGEGGHPPPFVPAGRLDDAVPVTGLSRVRSYQTAIARTAAKDKRGVCFRLEATDFENPTELKRELYKLLTTFKITTAEADLVIDLKEIPSESATTNAFVILGMFNNLPVINEWRSLTLAAGSFPINLSEVGSDAPHRIVSGRFKTSHRWALQNQPGF